MLAGSLRREAALLALALLLVSSVSSAWPGGVVQAEDTIGQVVVGDSNISVEPGSGQEDPLDPGTVIVDGPIADPNPGQWPAGGAAIASSLTAIAADPSPRAGSNNLIAITLLEQSGSQSSFSGNALVTVSGVKAAPDGSHGWFAGEELTSAATSGQRVSVAFNAGIAAIACILHAAGDQSVQVQVEGLPPASSVATLSLTCTSGPSARMVFARDPGSPTSPDGWFSPQPRIQIVDQFGNICDGAPESGVPTALVTAAKHGQGDWWLGPDETYVYAVDGVVPFTGLRASSPAGVNDARLTFTCPGLPPLISEPLSIPGGSTQSPQPRLSIVQDMLPPTAAGYVLQQQPVIEILDAAGNRMTDDCSTFVSVFATGLLGWQLTGERMVRAEHGLASFTNLSAINVPPNSYATLYFVASGQVQPVTGSTFALPNGSATPSQPQLSVEMQSPASVAGEEVDIVLTLRNAAGQPMGDFDGQHSVHVYQLQSAPDHTYGSVTVNQQVIPIADTNFAITPEFTDGVATISLAPTAAASHNLRFRVSEFMADCSVQMEVLAGSPARLSLDREFLPSPPGSPPETPSVQPILRLLDDHENLCRADSNTVVAVSLDPVVGCRLAGELTAQAEAGIVAYSTLEMVVEPGVSTIVTLVFSAAGLPPVSCQARTDGLPLAAALLSSDGFESSLVAGVSSTLRLQIVDTTGRLPMGESTQELVILGVTPSPDGSYGTFNGVGLSSAAHAPGQPFNVVFIDGVAEVQLRLDAAGTQNLRLSLDGNTEYHDLVVEVLPSPAAKLVLVQNIAAPAANGKPFSVQPVIDVQDKFGNLRTGDNTTRITVYRQDSGNWTLRGTVQRFAVNGIVTFTDLFAENLATVDGARLIFSPQTPLLPITSAAITLPAVVPGPPDPFAAGRISAGGRHTLAVRGDGVVLAWGANDYGQLGEGSYATQCGPIAADVPGVTVAVAAGANHSLALASDGRVYAWGGNEHSQLGTGDTRTHRSQPRLLSALSAATAIAAGDNHSVALLSDGKVVTWGDGDCGQLGHGDWLGQPFPVAILGLDQVRAIAAGQSHTVVLKQDGTVWAWGCNDHGQLGDGSAEDRNTPTQVQLPPGLEITAVSAGAGHTLALTRDGTVLAWGDNSMGQLGNGSNLDSQLPLEASALTSIGPARALSAGHNHSVAVLADGLVYSWGAGEGNELGDGSMSNSSTPVRANLLRDVRAIEAGARHSICLQEDNRVVCWGKGDAGQLGSSYAPEFGGPSLYPIFLAGRPHSVLVEASTLSPVAGQNFTLRFTVIDENGQRATNYDGDWFVTVSGVLQAPDGSFGTIAGHSMSLAMGGRCQSEFGAQLQISLNAAGHHRLYFQLESVENPAVGLDVNVIPAAANQVVIAEDILPPRADGWQFVRQPVLHLLDQFGNRCTNDYTTVATAYKLGAGRWVLTGNPSVIADGGVLAFRNLGVLQAEPDASLCLGFSVASFPALIGSTVTLWDQFDRQMVVTDADTSPLVGNSRELTFAMLNAQGQIDTSYNYTPDIIVSGAKEAPDGTCGEIGGIKLEQCALNSGQMIGVQFVNGVAKVPLVLHSTAEQLMSFFVLGASDQNLIRFTPVAGSPARLILQQDVQPPAVSDWLFPQQPVVALVDQFGNTCTEVGSGAVSASAKLPGWTLSGAADAQVERGVARFSFLRAAADDSSSIAQLRFSYPGLACIDSSSVLLPDPQRIPLVQPAIAAGATHYLALARDGRVYAWGRNDFGQLGNGSTEDSRTPVQVRGLRGVIAVAAGSGFSLALTGDGRVFAWGQNHLGQLGCGSGADQLTPRAVPGLTGVKAIAAGDAHAMAIVHNGPLVSWGNNNRGQAGLPPCPGGVLPNTRQFFSYYGPLTAISAGWEHSLALTADGTVFAWGGNSFGQLGSGAGDSFIPLVVEGLPVITAIAAGVEHSLAKTIDGTVYGFGSNEHGQLSNVGHGLAPAMLRDLVDVQVLSARNHSVALQNGSVYTWGQNWSGQLGRNTSAIDFTPRSVVHGAAAVGAGESSTVVLLPDGTVHFCGDLLGEAKAYFEPVGLSLAQVLGDTDGNGSINLIDLANVALAYGWRGSGQQVADVNSDGCVDLFDLVLVAASV